MRITTYLREDGGKDLDVFRQRSRGVLPVHLHTGLANHGHQRKLGVCLTQAVVGTRAKNEPVLGLLLGVTGNPTLRVERVSIRVGLVIVGRGPHRGDNHGALGDGDLVGDGEVLLHQVGHHDDGGPVAQSLLDDGAGVGQTLEQFHGDRDGAVTTTGLEVLLADLVKNLGTVSHQLEQPGRGGTSGILRGKQEGEDSLGNLEVTEVAQNLGRLLRRVNLNTLGDFLTVLGGVLLGLDPGVHDTRNLTTSGHASPTLSTALGELLHDHVGGLLAIPGLGVRQNDGEVDQLERSSDQVVVVGNLLDGLVGHVVTDESTARHGGHQLTEVGHPWSRGVLGRGGLLEEALEKLVEDLLEAREVARQSLAGKQTVQTLPVLDVLLAIQEHPVGLAEKLVGGIDDTGLHVAGRVEDLARRIARRGNHDKPGGKCEPIDSAGERAEVYCWVAHLWKTETQLNSPLSHFALYS